MNPGCAHCQEEIRRTVARGARAGLLHFPSAPVRVRGQRHPSLVGLPRREYKLQYQRLARAGKL